ncbi:hypothetical protein PPYR_15753 [Photinus pyralis]|uniref:Complex III assembly factor LYRM7 n=1 Tax=Photinus pyralis TaxID=7054 RepID=A0A5N3ZY22_PHOPY|nr:hypothetical protein PPYR_15753 [Photinus pyralis]
MSLRREVLKCFKNLHRTREIVFNGDVRALQKGREKINEEFKKNKDVQELATINEVPPINLIRFSEEVEKELRTTVVQAREIKPGVFQANIRPDTLKLDNIPYKDG